MAYSSANGSSDYGTIKYSQLVGIQQISNEIPKEFELLQNYPNPFNPNTVISYQLTVSSYAKLKVYNVLGNLVETLVNEKQNPGSYSVSFNAGDLSCEIYFYKLLINGIVVETKSMLLRYSTST